ncbi:MAG: T9SS type A sorting domain-containing protein [Bacteroidota bacterium]
MIKKLRTKYITHDDCLHYKNRSLRKIFTLLFFLFTFQFYNTTAQITTGFELDGNATASSPNPPDDWDLIFNNTSSAQLTTGIIVDPNNIFHGGGSKDDLDIPNWGWTTGTVPDKDDILHGGIALYNNCKLYFFADRYAVNGSANIGFWLFKKTISVNSNGTFSGVHTIGDILIVSEFKDGGGTSTIKVYKWVGSGGSHGALNLVSLGTNAFAITNTTEVNSPWPYTPKNGTPNKFPCGAFFEGGINLCNLNGIDPCFASFLISTRASFETNAVLKDFLNGSFTTDPQVTVQGGSRCINGPAVTLTANVTGGIPPFTYSWSPGGNTTSSITVTPTSTKTYTVAVTGANGCCAFTTAKVFVNPIPNVNAGADKELSCINTSTTLNGSSTTAGATFSWSTSDGNIVSGGNTNTPTVNAAGTYTLTVSANGCTATDKAVVTIKNTPPNVNAGPDKTLNCVVTQVTLNGSSSTPLVSFSWVAKDGGAILSGDNTATPIVQVPGKYVLTVFNPANGCTASDSALVFYDNAKPNANAGANMMLTCSVTSIMLNGSSTSVGATYSWSTIGGNIVTGGSSLTPTVNAAGTYILTVTNPGNGCTASDTAVVMLNNTPPYVNAGLDTLINCYNTTITLHSSTQSPNLIFLWTTTNGNITAGANTADVTVNAGGTYVLTVTDTINDCTAKDTVSVTVDLTPPNANAGADKTLNCIVTQVTLDGSSTTPGAAFMWVAKDGGVILSGANSATPLVKIPGKYVLTVTNPKNGCTAQDSANVFQDITAPNINAGPDKILNCITSSVVLNGSSTTIGATFSWSTVDGNIVSGGSSATPTVNATGTYVLTVTNPINGCEAMDVAVVTVDDTLPNVSAGIDMTLTCSETSIILNGSSATAGAGFSWITIGGNIVSGGNTAALTVDAGGYYILTVTDMVNGCSAKDTVKVFLNNYPPYVNAGPDKVITCKYPTVILHGSTQSLYLTFSWTTSNGNIVSGANTADATVNAAGTYILTVTDTISDCSASDTVVVTSDMTPPNANAGPDKTLTCAVTQVTLNGSSSTPGVTFMWVAKDGGVILSGGNTATPLVQIPGKYVLTVINPQNGCSAKDSANVYYNNTKPHADAGGDMVLNCTVDTLILDGSSDTPGALFYWNAYAGGIIVSGQATANPTVISAGIYVLTVIHPISGCTATDTAIVILDNTPPDVNAGADTVLCGDGWIMLNGSSSSNVGFNWTTMDGNIVSGANTANPIVDTTGIYILEVVDRINGCKAKDTVMVSMLPPLVINLGNDTSFTTCTHETITLDAGVTGSVYVWSTGATTQTITVSATGLYYVDVTTPQGCSDSDTIHIVIIDNSIDVDLGPDTTVCKCIKLTPGFIPGATYVWCGGQNYPSINVCQSGMYCVEVRTGNCIIRDTINVTINPPPVVNLGNDTIVINSLVLNAGNPGATFAWSTGATTQMITVTATGTYSVVVTDIYGCTATDKILVDVMIGIKENITANFTVNVYPNPSNDKTFTLSFEAAEKGNVEIQIINVLGRIVYSEQLENFKGTYNKVISLQNLSKGIYFADVVRENKRSVVKIILD